MEELLRRLVLQTGESSELALSTAARLFGHALLIGSLLMALTWWVTKKIGNGSLAKDRLTSESEIIITASNVLFLCVGMTAVMILVNDNLARAFAIGAAIALVRFRIKVAGKFPGMALFYGVLTGMACGVNRADLAWGVTIIFGVILCGVVTVREMALSKIRRDQTPEAPTQLAPALPKKAS